MNFWLIKSEPFKYSWEKFTTDQQTFWDGVRNYQARNNLMAMELGDLCLFYHSNEGKEVVGVAEVVKTHYQDPTTEETGLGCGGCETRLSIETPSFPSNHEIRSSVSPNWID